MNSPPFCIYIDTLCEGTVPALRDAKGYPYVFPTEIEVQREIADNQIARLQEFSAGERDFDDAMTVAEYVVKVDVLPDGSILDDAGNRFGANS